MSSTWLDALSGGVLIGISVSLMLLWNGRVTGISGILYSSIFSKNGKGFWQISFLLGLFCGGLLLRVFHPQAFLPLRSANSSVLIFGGLLVGFGTALAKGCTSGHGICGVSRLSLRSIVATCVFISAGVAVVFFVKKASLLL